MSLTLVILGSLCMVLLSIPLFMFAAIGSSILKGILFILPLSCFFSAGAVIYYYFHGATTAAYSWYLLPLFLVLFTYIIFPK